MARKERNACQTWIIFLLFVLFQMISIVHAEICRDKDVKCTEPKYKYLCGTSVYIQQECPKTCGLCTPSKEDIIFQNIIDAKDQNQKMMIVAIIFVVLFTLGIYKVYKAPTICRSKGTMKGKTVVITGGTSGIGYETAFHLAKRGARIIIGCCKLKKGLKAVKRLQDETGQKHVELKLLDLASLTSVRDFAFDIIEDLDKVDVLVNNAGIISKKHRCTTNDNYETTFQVNYLGHFLLTKLLLEKMKENPDGCRIINVVCEFQYGRLNFIDLQSKHAYNNMAAYYNSKLALVYFTHELSRVLNGTKVTSYAVNPGPSESNLWRHVFPYNYRVTWFFMVPWVYVFCKTASYGAETSYFCSLDKDIAQESGMYYKNCRQVDIGTFNDTKSKKLWDVSERLTEYYTAHMKLTQDDNKQKVNGEKRKKSVTFRDQPQEEEEEEEEEEDE